MVFKKRGMFRIIPNGDSTWVFPKILVPQNGWFIMENPMNKWMIWGYPYFWKHPHYFPINKLVKQLVYKNLTTSYIHLCLLLSLPLDSPNLPCFSFRSLPGSPCRAMRLLNCHKIVLHVGSQKTYRDLASWAAQIGQLDWYILGCPPFQ